MHSRKYRDLFVQGLLLTLTISLTPLQAETFFSDDFETGDFVSAQAYPWSWKVAPNGGNIENAMMRGDVGDVYSVTDERAYSGNYSLKMDFGGRNGWCNICGSESVTLSTGDAQSGCFSSPLSDHEPFVFNKSNGFSKWDVSEASAGQICVDLQQPAGQPVIGQMTTGLSAGDEIMVPRRCGTNGNVGGSASRKSDCNKAINYFDGARAVDVGYGESISRRFYMYIPSITNLPGITLKLGYTHWQVDGGSVRSVKLKLSVQRNLQLELNAPNSETIVPDEYVGKNQWLYFEEVFTRESSEGARDAGYDLYVGPASAPVADLVRPVVSRRNFNLGALVDFSMHGNWQHNNDVSGAIYFDEIVISDAFVGPSEFDPELIPAERIDTLQ